MQAAWTSRPWLCKFRVAAIRRGRPVSASEGPGVGVAPVQPDLTPWRCHSRWCPPSVPCLRCAAHSSMAACRGQWRALSHREVSLLGPCSPRLDPGSYRADVSGQALPLGVAAADGASLPVSVALTGGGWFSPLWSAAETAPGWAPDVFAGVAVASPRSLAVIGASWCGAGTLVEEQTLPQGAANQPSMGRGVPTDECCVVPGAAAVGGLSPMCSSDGGVCAAPISNLSLNRCGRDAIVKFSEVGSLDLTWCPDLW